MTIAENARAAGRRLFQGLVVAAASFVGFGTVAALWDNPLFVRMTPAGEVEIVLLLALSALLGLYVAIKRPGCSIKTAGAGSILGFLGVACPVCNNLLVILIGGDILLTYYEPIRIYVALLGVMLAAFAVAREWKLREEVCLPAGATAGADLNE